MLRKLFITAVFGLFLTCTAFSQSVEKGTTIIGANYTLGIFNTSVTDKNANITSYGRAGYNQFVLRYDKSIRDRITLGGQFRYNSFILAKDTSPTEINQAWGMDFCGDAAFHFVRSPHVDIYAAASLGFAYIKLANSHFSDQGVYTAGGLAYNLYLGSRFYIGDHFGIILNIGYAGYDYPSGTATASGGATDKLSVFFSGSTYSIGLCYKFNQ